MTRKLEIPKSQHTKGSAADEWTNATAPAEAPAEPVRKLSLMFPESDHRATKGGAGLRGKTMIAEILELSRARNRAAEGYKWPDDVVASVLAQVVAEGGRWPDAVVASVLAQVESDREAAGDSAGTEVPAESAPARRTRRAPAKRTAPRRTA